MRHAMRFAPAFLAFLLASDALPALAATASEAPASKETSFESRLAGMRFRNIGPFRGGRVTAVAGVRGARNVHF
ncbi:MAG TPA: hypothetical protein PKA62_05780 [Thermoanaerobaculia bacterium]|nr:hypothetical protein [Thermoanaerobaculia bacterium]